MRNENGVRTASVHPSPTDSGEQCFRRVADRQQQHRGGHQRHGLDQVEVQADAAQYCHPIFSYTSMAASPIARNIAVLCTSNAARLASGSLSVRHVGRVLGVIPRRSSSGRSMRPAPQGGKPYARSRRRGDLRKIEWLELMTTTANASVLEFSRICSTRHGDESRFKRQCGQCHVP